MRLRADSKSREIRELNQCRLARERKPEKPCLYQSRWMGIIPYACLRGYGSNGLKKTHVEGKLHSKLCRGTGPKQRMYRFSARSVKEEFH